MKNIEIVRNEEYERRAVEILSTARHFVYFSTFKAKLTRRPIGYGCNQLLEKIIATKTKKVKINALLECGPKGKSISKLNKIIAARLLHEGAKVRYLEGRRIVHAKIILVDGVLLLAGSHNWSEGSLRRNFELSFLIRDNKIVKDVQNFFEREWTRAKPFQE